MNNKKGFTLTELLVAVVILGIVTGMSFPVIRRIRESNEKKQYEIYSNSITHSSKLYVDSYDEDLFGHNSSGCAYVTYEMLADKNLTEDIDMKDLSCNSKNTFIRVVKLDDKYAYQPFLGCGDENNDKEIKKVSVIYPEANKPHEMVTENCRGTEGENISIKVKPSEQTKYVKKVSPRIIITSPTGIKSDADIDYGWSTTNSYSEVSTFSDLTFSIPSKTTQENQIMKSYKAIEISSKVTTPNTTGIYYLVLKINKLVDLYDTGYVAKKVEYKVYGPYYLDNTPPTISKLEVKSTTNNYNNKDVKLTIDGSDNVTKKENLQMCISTSSSCTNYENFSASKDFNVGGNYDGSTRTIYLYMRDELGNQSSKTITYTVYKECQDSNLIVRDSWNKDGSCSAACGYGIQKYTAASKDKNNGALCPQILKKEEQCKEHDCCTISYSSNVKLSNASETVICGQYSAVDIYATPDMSAAITQSSSVSVSCSGSYGSIATTDVSLSKSQSSARVTIGPINSNVSCSVNAQGCTWYYQDKGDYHIYLGPNFSNYHSYDPGTCLCGVPASWGGHLITLTGSSYLFKKLSFSTSEDHNSTYWKKNGCSSTVQKYH